MLLLSNAILRKITLSMKSSIFKQKSSRVVGHNLQYRLAISELDERIVPATYVFAVSQGNFSEPTNWTDQATQNAAQVIPTFGDTAIISGLKVVEVDVNTINAQVQIEPEFTGIFRLHAPVTQINKLAFGGGNIVSDILLNGETKKELISASNFLWTGGTFFGINARIGGYLGDSNLAVISGTGNTKMVDSTLFLHGVTWSGTVKIFASDVGQEPIPSQIIVDGYVNVLPTLSNPFPGVLEPNEGVAGTSANALTTLVITGLLRVNGDFRVETDEFFNFAAFEVIQGNTFINARAYQFQVGGITALESPPESRLFDAASIETIR